MLKTFTVNGTEYKARKVDYNLVCDLDRYGANLMQLATGSGTFGLARAYLAVCGGMTLAQAGNEIEQHYLNGGEMSVIIDVLAGEMEESDFFQRMLEEMAEKIQTMNLAKKNKENKENKKSK